MLNRAQVSLALGAMVAISVLLGSWMDHRPVSARASEGEAQPKFLQLLGHQKVGPNLLFSVYCDVERGHLIYTYTVAGGESPNGNLVVLKDGCKGGK